MADAPHVLAGGVGTTMPRRHSVVRYLGRTLARRLPAITTALTLLVLWEWMVALGVTPRSVAAPTAIWEAFARSPEQLWSQTRPTLTAAIIGFVLSSSVAIAISIVTAFVPRTTNVVYNVAVVTYSIPLIALAPVLLVWIGNGPSLRITIAAIAGFFPVMVACVQGFRAVDVGRHELFDQLSATRGQRFRLLVVPEALPYVFAGLKVGAASAVLGAIIAEWSGASSGLGVAMIAALSAFNPAGVWLAILASTALTISLYATVSVVERLVVQWEYDADAVAARS